MSDSGYLVAGLGNPGRKYELTRHNAGFLAIDYFADQHGLALNSTKWGAKYTRVRFADRSVVFVMPQNFMNRSGMPVARFTDFYKIDPGKILIIHDDLDLPAGRIKVVASGGAGGHNGIRSIISHLGLSDFARLKIGIGRPARNENGQGMPVDRYVLSSFSDSELSLFNDRLSLVDEAVDLFLARGVVETMNSINGR